MVFKYLQPVFFTILILITGFVLIQRVRFIIRSISLGRPVQPKGNITTRLKTMLLIAFGQKKMFTDIPIAILHLFLYLGFIIINIEIFEFLIDGFSGTHRYFAWLPKTSHSHPANYHFYYHRFINVFEVFCLLVIVACIIFLIRRNGIKVKRFSGIEMKKWPLLDANLILIFEILLMLAILFMNAFDQLLQIRQVPGFVYTGQFYISRIIIFPFIDHLPTAIALVSERFFWWFHMTGICGFAIYITYSKHLHIFLAFPNTYFSRNTAVASIPNMDSITREVRHMMGITDANSNYTDPSPIRFGARDIQDLTRKNLLESFSCTECGRCTSVCPANQTGKKLSPRKIMMDVRDRAEELTRNQGKNTEKLENFLLDHYITREEIFACTTCYACTGICPVNIDPVSVIIQIRQFLVMEESGGPASWNSMFMNMETNESPWKVPQSERINWMD